LTSRPGIGSWHRLVATADRRPSSVRARAESAALEADEADRDEIIAVAEVMAPSLLRSDVDR